ncbi:DUF4352 domain-containing protein [Fusobacterium sp. PH5-44]|uniref:DUF4352 domain-containing protein n=1 Tax=unclassified Fusobacterium TaxID=2648384 RepID=UPI003D1D4D55
MKKFLVILMLAFGMTTFSQEEKSKIIWDIKVNSLEVKETLNTVTPVTQYDRSVVDVKYDNIPATGNVYVLINLDINKTAGGNRPFVWANFSLIDTNGNKYHRVENDNFLQDHNYTRMRGDDLKLGKNSGVIAIEVPKDKSESNLYLEYEYDGEVKKVEVK